MVPKFHTFHISPNTVYPHGWFSLIILDCPTEYSFDVMGRTTEEFRSNLVELEAELSASLDSVRRCLENLTVPETSSKE